MGLAIRGKRILLTEDKDFGQLVFAAGRGAIGILLLRYPPRARPRLPSDVADLLCRKGESLRGSFAVVQPGRIRIRRLGRMPGGGR